MKSTALFIRDKNIFALIVCILCAESVFSQEKSESQAPAAADSIKEKRLDEVIVLGYGTTTQESFTGTAKKVDAKNIAAKNVSNVSSALAGEVAGVTVLSTSGQPGTIGTIRIRGYGSIEGSRDPLYVVDGVPFLGAISSINPGDIASITVLKDASAIAIYGSRGSNGVVLISTKSGRNASYIEVEQRIGFNMSLPRSRIISSPEEYTELAWEALYNKGVIDLAADPAAYASQTLFGSGGISRDYNIWQAPGDSLIDPATRKFRSGIARRYTPERWGDIALRNPLRSETNIRLGQGSDKTSYYISLGYLGDKGYQIETSFQRYTATLNLSHKIKEWLRGGANISYGYTDFKNNGQIEDSRNIFSFLDNIPPIYPVYLRDASGKIVPDNHYGGNQYDFGRTGRGYSPGSNPIAEATLSSTDTKRHNATGSLNLDIDFTKWLSLENRLGAQYSSFLQTYFQNPFYGDAASQGGKIYKSNGEFLAYNILNLLRFTHGFGEHHLEIAAAHEFNYSENRNLEATKYNLALPFISDLNNAVVTSPSFSYTTQRTIESYFAQVNYDYKGKYFFSATLRRDGGSIFLKNKWGNFGSIGFTWAAHKEGFMSGQHIFSSLKIKVSYGSIGNQSIGSRLYTGYDEYDASNLNNSPAISFTSKGNPDLTWETSRMFQAGTEFSIKRYVDVAVDYYYKLTDNLFFPRNIGSSSGYESVLTNEGALVNRGVEFDITGHIVDKKSWLLDVSVNGQFLSSSFDYLPVDPTTGREKTIDISAPFARARGASIGGYYLREWAGVDPKTGAPMWNMYYDDLNKDNMVQDAEKIRSLHDYQRRDTSMIRKTTTYRYAEATQTYSDKNGVPTVSGAININAGYKGISLRIQFIYSLGGYGYDYAYAYLMRNPQAGGNNYSIDIRERWQKEGDITDIPRIVSNAGEDANASEFSTRFLIRSDYLQLNNVRIGYTLPAKLSKAIKMEQIDIWASGDNLFALTARRGFFPYVSESGQSSIYTYVPLSTFSFGIKLRF